MKVDYVYRVRRQEHRVKVSCFLGPPQSRAFRVVVPETHRALNGLPDKSEYCVVATGYAITSVSMACPGD